MTTITPRSLSFTACTRSGILSLLRFFLRNFQVGLVELSCIMIVWLTSPPVKVRQHVHPCGCIWVNSKSQYHNEFSFRFMCKLVVITTRWWSLNERQSWFRSTIMKGSPMVV
jgi:hypothetical protein